MTRGWDDDPNDEYAGLPAVDAFVVTPMDDWDGLDDAYCDPPDELDRLIDERPAKASRASVGDAEGVDPAMLEYVNALGVTGPAAWRMATKLGDRVEYETVAAAARQYVRDRDAERTATLDAIEGGTALDLLALNRPALVPSLGYLVSEGHNVLIPAPKKVGKTTILENMSNAWTTGASFLGRFEVPTPQRVLYMNYELTPEDFDQRVRLMGLDDEAAKRLYVLNLRGHRVPLTTPTGRDWLVRVARDHHADVLIVDPFGAAYAAAGGQSENDNAEARRFLASLDEIKRLAGVRTLVMPHHTGRGEQVEGEERGRGATVLEDWADVILYLTKDRAGVRYLRSEGRATDLPESRLEFDPATTRLYLGTGDVGVNRRLARRAEGARLAAQVVAETPGLKKGDLTDALGLAGLTNNDDKSAAIAAAIKDGYVHTHAGIRTAIHHYPGQAHGADEQCPRGHRNA